MNHFLSVISAVINVNVYSITVNADNVGTVVKYRQRIDSAEINKPEENETETEPGKDSILTRVAKALLSGISAHVDVHVFSVEVNGKTIDAVLETDGLSVTKLPDPAEDSAPEPVKVTKTEKKPVKKAATKK